jgi:hypothetical protein
MQGLVRAGDWLARELQYDFGLDWRERDCPFRARIGRIGKVREEMTMFGVGGGARGTDVRALVRKGDGERGVGERRSGYI